MQSVATTVTPPTAPCRLRRMARHLPAAITLIVVAAMLVHGVIVQPDGYHDFADHSSFAGLPHAADVLSNIGFALVGLWGGWRLAGQAGHPRLAAGWFGYRLLLIGLVLTAAGSSYYHLAPDDVRLIWDRLPIAIACAGLLAAVRAETVAGSVARGMARIDARSEAALLALFAVASVAWWHFSNGEGQGDLRPYLLLQVLPIALVPLWQWLYGSDRQDRLHFGAALAVYVLAKIAELNDHVFLAANGLLSGHTLKHLLATLAAWLIVRRLVQRVRSDAGRNRMPASKP